MSLITDYFNHLVKYQGIYGPLTTVIMQVGKFFEIYSIINSKETIGNAEEISRILDITLTKKNKKVLECNRKNPFMTGFPIGSKDYYIPKLLDNNYTVVIIEETTPAPNCVRKVTEICSPGTSLNYTTFTENIMSIYIEKGCIGATVINITTRDVTIHELYNTEDLNIFINRYSPSEIICNTNITFEGIKIIKVPSEVTTNRYQNQYLAKIYPQESMITPLEYLGIENIKFATTSLVLLLDFLYIHNESILIDLKYPEIYDEEKYMFLFNSLEQLNIIDKSRCNVFTVINKTITVIGKRKLKCDLMFPLRNVSLLQDKYNDIEVINKVNVKIINSKLKLISDIEKLQRKMSLGTLSQHEFILLHNSYVAISDILAIVKDNKFLTLNNTLEIDVLINSYINIFDISDELKFKSNVYPEIDELQKVIEISTLRLDEIAEKYSTLINASIKVTYQDKTGYFLATTNVRSNLLKKKTTDELIINSGVSGVKITSKDINKLSDTVVSTNIKLQKIITDMYKNVICIIYSSNKELMDILVEFVGKLDVLMSNYKCYKQLNFNRPTITNSINSKLTIKALRHPLIENINIDVKYTSNDIILDKDNSTVLYGLNKSGKCHAKDTMVIMYNGIPKKVQDIVIGDRLLGVDYKPRKVLSTTEGIGMLYKVTNNEGDSYVVNKEHILCLTNNKNVKVNISVNEYLESSNVTNLYDYKLNSINWKYTEVLIDPYILGNYLVNGLKFVYVNPKIERYIRKKLALYNCILVNDNYYTKNNQELNLFFIFLTNYKCTGTGIPKEYLYNSRRIRLYFLSGVLDSYGYNINHNSKQFIKDLVFLIRSLAITCKIVGDYDEVHVIPEDMNNKWIKVEEYGLGAYYGFELDKDQLYIMDNFVVTHNSSLIKSIGVSVILAQAGMYVPCDSMEFSIYNKVITRINSSDNILKGNSSFEVEMIELGNILRNSDQNTLVIMDELCKGTETVSANALVASALIELHSKYTSFILATHLRFISEYHGIKNIIKIKHLSVEILEDNIIYNRKLIDGPGSELYGLEVAKYLGLPKNFITQAYLIRNELIGKPKTLLSTKKSRYNKDKLVDQCELCSYKPVLKTDVPLDTHHINFQCTFGTADIGVHDKHNLTVLCVSCHQSLHAGNIKINGYVDTGKGVILDIKK